MPTYGRSFTLTNTDKHGPNAPATGGGREGVYTKESGFLAYYEICEMLLNGAVYVWDEEMKVPYMVDGDQVCSITVHKMYVLSNIQCFFY